MTWNVQDKGAEPARSSVAGSGHVARSRYRSIWPRGQISLSLDLATSSRKVRVGPPECDGGAGSVDEGDGSGDGFLVAGSGSFVAGSGWREYGLSNTTWFGAFGTDYRGISGLLAALRPKEPVLAVTLVPGIPVYSVYSRIPVYSSFAGSCTFGVSLLLFYWSRL